MSFQYSIRGLSPLRMTVLGIVTDTESFVFHQEMSLKYGRKHVDDLIVYTTLTISPMENAAIETLLLSKISSALYLCFVFFSISDFHNHLQPRRA